MKNSILCLMVAICIIICSINLYITTQIKSKDEAIEEPIQSEEVSLEETSEYSYSEESVDSQEETSEESFEYSNVDETSEEISEEVSEDKHLMGATLPDVITNLNVNLYNQNHPDYIEDAWVYFNDIYSHLLKYAPDGMWISAVMAQAYTEGGAGKSGIYTRTNNCFGIMAGPSWDGYVYARSHGLVFKDYSTAKQYGAYGLFRAYPSIEESIKDYVVLIQGDRYSSALNTSSSFAYLSVLLRNGYGESHMINTWTQVINKFNLTQFDKESDLDGVSESR